MIKLLDIVKGHLNLKLLDDSLRLKILDYYLYVYNTEDKLEGYDIICKIIIRYYTILGEDYLSDYNELLGKLGLYKNISSVFFCNMLVGAYIDKRKREEVE